MKICNDDLDIKHIDNMYIRIDNNYYRKEKLNRILNEI